MRAIILVGLPAFVLILICMGVSAVAHEDSSASLEWEAQYTGQAEPFEKVISTEPDFWAEGETLFHGSQLPDVDFKKNVAVCVCLGERMTGGYRIVFRPPHVSDDVLVIAYHEKRPSGITTQALDTTLCDEDLREKEGQKVQVKRNGRS